MPLNHILRKSTAGCNLCKSQENINHLMYMHDIKLFAKNEKELENLIQTVKIYNHDTVLYSHVPYHNDTIIKTHAMITDAIRLLYKNIYLSLYCKGSKGLFKVCVWEGAGDRTTRKYFDPKVMVGNVLLFSFSSGPQFNQGSREPLRPGVAFPITSLL